MPPQLLTTSFPLQGAAKILDLTGFSAVKDVTNRKPTTTMNRILIPGNMQKLSKHEMIEQFLGEWLTKKQRDMSGEWFHAMLESFYNEVVIQQNLRYPFSPVNDKKQWTHSLPIASEKKPHRTKIEIEEVSGELDDNANLIMLADVKPSADQPPEHPLVLMGTQSYSEPSEFMDSLSPAHHLRDNAFEGGI